MAQFNNRRRPRPEQSAQTRRVISARVFTFFSTNVTRIRHGLIQTAPMQSPQALTSRPNSSLGSIFNVWQTTSRYQPSGKRPLKNGNNVRLSYGSARDGNATAIGSPSFKKFGSYVKR